MPVVYILTNQSMPNTIKIGVTEKQFIEISDNFTNKKIFKTDQRGKLIKDNNGSLTKLKYDN